PLLHHTRFFPACFCHPECAALESNTNLSHPKTKCQIEVTISTIRNVSHSFGKPMTMSLQIKEMRTSKWVHRYCVTSTQCFVQLSLNWPMLASGEEKTDPDLLHPGRPVRRAQSLPA